MHEDVEEADYNTCGYVMCKQFYTCIFKYIHTYIRDAHLV